jgi:NADH:ubiquinone oxidoreductase subunit 4 (subunit M)
MLLAIMKLYLLTGSLNISYLKQVNLPFSTQKLCFLSFSIAMAVKMPMFPFHI